VRQAQGALILGGERVFGTVFRGDENFFRAFPYNKADAMKVFVLWTLVGLTILSGWLSGLANSAMAPHPHPKVEWTLFQWASGMSTPLTAALALSGLAQGDRVLAVLEIEGEPLDLAAELSSLGAAVVETHGSLLKAWLPRDSLLAIAELPEVGYVRLSYFPIPLGRLASEGVTVLGASLFHAKGVLGQGVRVALIDVGFSSLTQAIHAGEIKSEAIVWKRDYAGSGLESGGSHGTAVAQIVHNLAPQAELFLARIGDEVGLGRAVSDLVAEGVDIIVHAVGWANTEFGDGRGVVSEIARRAAQAGILWINAAGNHAQRHWLGTPRILPDGWVEFAPGLSELSLRVEIPGLVQIALTWDEWPRASSDFDLFLFDGRGELVASSENLQAGYAPPTEFLSALVDPGRYTIRVRAKYAPSPVPLEIFSLSHDLSPCVPHSSILPPGNAEEVFTVGAVNLGNWATGPQAPYSSQGPTRDGRLKPDIAGLDGTRNFVYPQFFGTSAAAAHLGGMAALLLSQARGRGENLGLAELRELLVRWAVDFGDPGPDPVYGYGRLNVFVEPAWGERRILRPQNGVAQPGEEVEVEITVRVPSTQVGMLELREILPEGLSGTILDRGGADEIREGKELLWRWYMLLPGETRTVRYRFLIPSGFPAGTYTLTGSVNRDPLGGDAAFRVEPDPPPSQPQVRCAPNPVRVGGTVEFTVLGSEAAQIRVYVYDLSGRLVYESGWQPGPTHQWNLQDLQGRIVASGVYLFWAEVKTEGKIVRSGLGRLLVLR